MWEKDIFHDSLFVLFTGCFSFSITFLSCKISFCKLLFSLLRLFICSELEIELICLNSIEGGSCSILMKISSWEVVSAFTLPSTSERISANSWVNLFIISFVCLYNCTFNHSSFTEKILSLWWLHGAVHFHQFLNLQSEMLCCRCIPWCYCIRCLVWPDQDIHPPRLLITEEAFIFTIFFKLFNKSYLGRSIIMLKLLYGK